jgi:hypothetical protein
MIVLLACSKTKLDHAAPAAELYQGALLRLTLQYARALNPDQIYILSALHHALRPEQLIQPYERTLPTDRRSRELWASIVWRTLEAASGPADTFLALAPQAYCKEVAPLAKSCGRRWIQPLQGLGIGRQKQYLLRALRGLSGQSDLP